MTKTAGVLRNLLSSEPIVVAPGVNECIGAAIVERLGFKAAYMTGAGTAACIFGKPDMGLVSMTEVVGAARNVAETISIPLICDADTGYGGVLNVWRTARLYANAGAAAIHLEDQAGSKRSGGMAGRTVIPIEEMVAKIHAAREAVGDDLVIIARTDARYLGVDAVVERLTRYLKAGAELAMLAEYYTLEELRQVMGQVKPLALTAGLPHTPQGVLSVGEHTRMGTKLLLYAPVALTVAARAITDTYTVLQETGHLSAEYLRTHALPRDEVFDLVGESEWTSRQEGFSGPS
jgi:2-methylisocitrate lyase-like PEP mutase family enzyme